MRKRKRTRTRRNDENSTITQKRRNVSAHGNIIDLFTSLLSFLVNKRLLLSHQVVYITPNANDVSPTTPQQDGHRYINKISSVQRHGAATSVDAHYITNVKYTGDSNPSSVKGSRCAQ